MCVSYTVQFEKALVLYLDVQIKKTAEESNIKKNLQGTPPILAFSTQRDFYAAFDLIENNVSSSCVFDVFIQLFVSLFGACFFSRCAFVI